MRYISMHKSNAASEAGVLPDPELIAGMGVLIGEMHKAGVFECGEGLRASVLGVRLHFAGGRMRRVGGPFTGVNELPAAFTIVKVRDIEEAVAWALRHAQMLGMDQGEGEIDIRPVTEACDLGMAPPPPIGAPMRYMLLIKADRHSEAGAPLTPAKLDAMRQLHADMKQAGVFVAAEGIQPSALGLRLNFSDGARRVTDGPFTESKELVAGYCIFRVRSREEVVAWCTPFAKLMGDVELDIRPLYAPADVA